MASIAKNNGPFDVKTVEALVALMSEHDLSEIYLREGEQHIRLRRGAVAPTSVPAAVPMTLAHAPAPATARSASESAPTAPAAANKNLLEIKSETVGIFYSQPKPGAPPYVKLGDRVKPDTVVGVIVVMKTNNEIQAGCSGVIVEVLIKNEESIEFGQPLFRVEP